MQAQLSCIDHVHIFTNDRDKACDWYCQHLGFEIDTRYQSWAEDPAGPLTLPNGEIHIALFKRDSAIQSRHIAFGCDAKNFLLWREYLSSIAALKSCSDHQLSWSLYFEDPWSNQHEITCYDHHAIRSVISES